MILGLAAPVFWASLCLLLAIALVAWLVIVPSGRLPVSRRRYGVENNPSLLTRSADAATGAISGVLARRGQTERFAAMLDRAGLRMDPADFVLLVGAGVIAGFAAGMVLGGPFVAVLLAMLAVVGSVMFVVFRSDKRKSDFADQVDDILQLLASSLRAGHSVLQALDSATTELDEPAASEITRVVNQVRVGRDLGVALDEAATRMDSDEFRWVSQAVAIHRQVGGNLADVLDTVAGTIRERGQVRRQVKALAAEGKLSGIILVCLPIVVVLALAVLNPEYIGALTKSFLGWAMIVAGIVELTIGALWLRKVSEVKF